jgi:hypothetical protein
MSFFNSIFNILRFNKSNWKAVVLCLFTATVIWFFNSLNKNYTTTIGFPVSFDYDRENFVTIRPLPLSVRINVTGIGWNLFRRSAGVRVPALVIPLENPAEVKKIVGSTLPAFFANQLADFQINFVITDTLHIAIEPKMTRKLGLSVEVPSGFIRKGYVLVSDLRVEPDSISLEGPQTLMQGLPDPVKLQLSQRDIDENFNETIDVRFLNDELIKRAPSAVTVAFEVEELVEVSDSVALEVINAPKEVREVQLGKIPFKMTMPASAAEFFESDSLKAVIDLTDFKKGEAKVLPRLVGTPPNSQTIVLDSILIKF